MLRRALIISAFAAASQASADMHRVANLTVIPGWSLPAGNHMAGLRIELSEGWKTYWRAPGDGGIPPTIDLSSSINIATAQFHWPVPEVFDQNGMRSIGYIGGVVLPIELSPRRQGPMRMSGTIQIGVCQEVCVPVELSFDSALPETSQREPDLLAALLDRPLTAAEAGVTRSTCDVEPISDGLQVTTYVTMPGLDGDEEIVVETGDRNVWVSDPSTQMVGNGIMGVVEMVPPTGEPFLLDRSAVRITVLDDTRAVDVIGCTAD